MSTITRERAELKAFITGFLSDPAHDNQSSRSLTTEVFRIALASLEAEPVMYLSRQNTTLREQFGTCDDWEINARLVEADFPAVEIPESDNYEFMPLYTAPPAPVSVPDAYIRDERGRMMLNGRQEPRIGYGAGWNACRAAMLQGAENVTTDYKLPAIGWLRADYQDDNRGLRGNAPLFVLGKKDPSTVWGLDYIPLTSNSPVVLDGACPCCGRKQLKNRTCSVSGCDGKHVAHGFCKKHYDIERKKDPSRRESIRAADKRYRARKAVVPHQEVR